MTKGPVVIREPSKPSELPWGHPIKNWALSTARVDAGLKQEELGSRIGKSQQTICHIENLDRRPSKEIKFLISYELGIAEDVLFPNDLNEFYGRKDQPMDIYERWEREKIDLDNWPGDSPDGFQFRYFVQLGYTMDACLTPMQKLVLELRYGFFNGSCFSLRKTGDLLGVSHQYVLLREQEALDELREVIG